MDNLLLIIVGVIFLICIIVGCVRGALRIGISLVATVATIALVIFVTPYVGGALHKYSPIDEYIAKQCVELFAPSISAESLAGADLTGTPLEGYSAEELAELDLESLGIDVRELAALAGDIPKDTQISAIESAPLPQFFKKNLLENNNSVIYNKLSVTSFPEYVAAYISNIVINILSFLISFMLVTILVKALIIAVDLLSELPLLGGINRLAGGILGMFIALVIVWIGFLIITLLYTTKIGVSCFEQISQSQILTFLYDNNIILNLLLK